MHVLALDEGDPNAAAQQKGLNYDLWAETARRLARRLMMSFQSMPREHAIRVRDKSRIATPGDDVPATSILRRAMTTGARSTEKAQ